MPVQLSEVMKLRKQKGKVVKRKQEKRFCLTTVITHNIMTELKREIT
jgi:hypothetical protein